MSRPAKRLPRMCAWLLRAALPRDVRDDMLAELDALYGHRHVRAGALSTWLWLARQIFLVPIGFLRAGRAGERSDATSPGLARPAPPRPSTRDALAIMFDEIRHAARSLRKDPAVTLLAVIILMIGIGGTTVGAAVVDGVLMQPLTYDAGQRITHVWTFDRERGIESGASFPDFLDWRAEAESYEAMVAYIRPTFARATIGFTEGAEKVERGLVSAGFFELFDVAPVLGRTFTAQEYADGEAVAVISSAMWRQRFGADPAIVGTEITIDNGASTVIGVMPAGFAVPDERTDVWEPFRRRFAEGDRGADVWVVLGRLGPGVAPGEAQREMSELAALLAREYPDTNQGREAVVRPLLEQVTGSSTSQAVWLLLGAAVLVLAIALTNVSALLLTRGERRLAELETRVALGANRGRLIRLLLIESVVLFSVAGVLGAVLGTIGVDLLVSVAPAGIARLDGVTVQPAVLAVIAGLTLFAALASGLVPALRATRAAAAPRRTTRASAAGASRRFVDALVIGEIALGLTLLWSTGLLVRSFTELQRVDTGYRPEEVVVVSTEMSMMTPRARAEDFYRRALERAAAIPGVVSAGAITDFFFERQPDVNIVVEGRPAAPSTEAPPLTRDSVSPGYFEALGVPLLRGRLFDPRDLGRTGSVVINDAMARAFWPDADAVGRRFRLARPDTPWLTVVGVVADLRRDAPEVAPIAQYFEPGLRPAMDIVLRLQAPENAAAASAAARDAVRAIDPTIPITGVATARAWFDASIAGRRFSMQVATLFTVIAALLAGVGIYGLVQSAVTQRTRELGIRLAIGASPRVLRRDILTSAMKRVAAGICLGTLGAALATRAIASVLFGISPFDPLTGIAVTSILLAIGLSAAWIPARRAMRIDPQISMRAS